MILSVLFFSHSHRLLSAPGCEETILAVILACVFPWSDCFSKLSPSWLAATNFADCHEMYWPISGTLKQDSNMKSIQVSLQNLVIDVFNFGSPFHLPLSFSHQQKKGVEPLVTNGSWTWVVAVASPPAWPNVTRATAWRSWAWTCHRRCSVPRNGPTRLPAVFLCFFGEWKLQRC